MIAGKKIALSIKCSQVLLLNQDQVHNETDSKHQETTVTMDGTGKHSLITNSCIFKYMNEKELKRIVIDSTALFWFLYKQHSKRILYFPICECICYLLANSFQNHEAIEVSPYREMRAYLKIMFAGKNPACIGHLKIII